MNKQLLLVVIVLFSCLGCAGHHYTKEGSDAVSLYLNLPDVDEVKFASSIDNFKQHDTHKNGFGFWEISIPLRADSTYFYLVDGAVFIPDCRFRETDDFGSENCVYLP